MNWYIYGQDNAYKLEGMEITVEIVNNKDTDATKMYINDSKILANTTGHPTFSIFNTLRNTNPNTRQSMDKDQANYYSPVQLFKPPVLQKKVHHTKLRISYSNS